jgi:hypothetical protein
VTSRDHALYQQVKHWLTGEEPSPLTQISVRIQENVDGLFSHRYNRTALYPKIMSVEFFAWFAHYNGFTGYPGPAELRFIFKDTPPAQRFFTITSGDEEDKANTLE